MENLKLRLTKVDWDKWSSNTLLFLAPLGVLYLVFVQTSINADGIQGTDFIPTREVMGGMVLYLINTLLDFLKKFVLTK